MSELDSLLDFIALLVGAFLLLVSSALVVAAAVLTVLGIPAILYGLLRLLFLAWQRDYRARLARLQPRSPERLLGFRWPLAHEVLYLTGHLLRTDCVCPVARARSPPKLDPVTARIP